MNLKIFISIKRVFKKLSREHVTIKFIGFLNNKPKLLYRRAIINLKYQSTIIVNKHLLNRE